jgi:hypothetical protein
MLYYLLYFVLFPMRPQFSVLNVTRYITFRTAAATLRLKVGLVDAERAAAELVAVHDQVVRVGERVGGVVGEGVLPFVRRPRERVVHGCPTLRLHQLLDELFHFRFEQRL